MNSFLLLADWASTKFAPIEVTESITWPAILKAAVVLGSLSVMAIVSLINFLILSKIACAP
jgi:hypothetical protein